MFFRLWDWWEEQTMEADLELSQQQQMDGNGCEEGLSIGVLEYLKRPETPQPQTPHQELL